MNEIDINKNFNTSEKINSNNKSNTKNSKGIFAVRFVISIIILLGTLFIKFSSRCYYDNFKFWYQNNVLEDKYHALWLKDGIKNIYSTSEAKFVEIISFFKNHDN